jgi:hypothetical protein
MPSIAGSKSPGTETLSTPAGSLVRFSKSWVVPPGASTNDPLPASIQRPPQVGDEGHPEEEDREEVGAGRKEDSRQADRREERGAG